MRHVSIRILQSENGAQGRNNSSGTNLDTAGARRANHRDVASQSNHKLPRQVHNFKLEISSIYFLMYIAGGILPSES